MSQPPPNFGNAKPPAPRHSLWQQTQSILRKTTARSLRSIIWLLERALVNVEPEAPEAARIAAEPTPPLFRQINRVWAWLLKTIRSILPRSQRENLSDTALSGIIIGTVLLIVWVNSALKPKSAPEAQIAARPAIEQPAPEVSIPDSLPAPAAPTPVIEPAIEPEPIAAAPEPVASPAAEIPSVNQEPEVSEPESEPEPIEPEPEAIEPEPEVGEPEAEAIEPLPAEPEPEVAKEPLPEAAAVEVEPLPLPQLTPEQTLVAAIQEQVGDITKQYGNGLIQTIQANFRSQRLTAKLDDAWYELSQTRQNQLAAELFEQARSLNFTRLELVDSQGTLLARSPIVGTEMIILRRSIDERKIDLPQRTS